MANDQSIITSRISALESPCPSQVWFELDTKEHKQPHESFVLFAFHFFVNKQLTHGDPTPTFRPEDQAM